MIHARYASRLANAVFTQRAWMIAAFVLLAVNAALVSTLLGRAEHRETVFLPPRIDQPFQLNNGQWSAAYVEQVATWFTGLVLTYTPESYEYQASVFLKHADPAAYGALQAQLLEEHSQVKKRRNSSVFFVQRVRPQGLRAAVTGLHQVFVGNQKVDERKATWLVALTQRHDGLVTVQHFKEVPDEASAFADRPVAADDAG